MKNFTYEQFVICRALYKRDKDIFEACTVDDFPSEPGKKCFEELQEAYYSNSDFDDKSFIERFELSYAGLIDEDIKSHSNFYAPDMLLPTFKNHSMRKQVKTISAELTTFCDDPAFPAERIMEKLKDAYEISHIVQDTGLKTIKDVAHKTLQIMEQRRKGEIKYLSLGLEALDDKIKVVRGDLIVLAARPRIGKTAIGLDMCRRSALAGQNTVFICLETDEDQLYERLLSQQSGIPHKMIQSGLSGCSEHELNDVALANQALTSANINIISRYGQTIGALRKLCKRLKSQGADVIYIDYLQKIKCSGRKKRFEEMMQVSQDLKELALELDIAIVALAQINRQAGNDKPRLEHLAQSSQIEQDASVVVLIDRPDVDAPEIHPRDYKDSKGRKLEESELTGRLFLLIAKNRTGSTATLMHDYDFSKYVITGRSVLNQPRYV